MMIQRAKYDILRPKRLDQDARNAILSIIEEAARTSYKSPMSGKDAGSFVADLIHRGHYGILEHAVMTVRWIVDIGVGREMVRHRIASFVQESTRYCNYSKNRFGNQVTFILPQNLKSYEAYDIWKRGCEEAEKAYFDMLKAGEPPEMARGMLNLNTKAELVSTMNLREWRHFFKLRAADETGPAHPQMKQVTVPLLKELQGFLPEIFGDIVLPEDEDNG